MSCSAYRLERVVDLDQKGRVEARHDAELLEGLGDLLGPDDAGLLDHLHRIDEAGFLAPH